MTAQRLHRVVVQRNGHGWRAMVEGLDGVGTMHVSDLSQVEPTARKVIWGYCGANPDDIEIDVEIHLPTAIQVRLNLAEQLCEDATLEVEAAINLLIDLGVSVLDIGRILRRRGQSAPRQLTITNEEIVHHGLVRHPKALGIQLDEGGRFVTIVCRTCLEQTRMSYIDLDPTKEHILLYENPLRCGICPRKRRQLSL